MARRKPIHRFERTSSSGCPGAKRRFMRRTARAGYAIEKNFHLFSLVTDL